MWTDDYKKILHALKAKNGDPFIKDVRVYNDGSSMGFEVILSEEHKKEAEQEGYLKKFKLETKISTTNMHLLMNKKIKKYHTPEEIIEDFYPPRLALYRDRKEKMAETLKKEKKELQGKIQYLKDVHQGDIVVVGRLEIDIIKELGSGVEKFLELSLTKDQLLKLEEELEKRENEIEYLNSSTDKSMYEEDLKKLESMLCESESNSRKRGIEMCCQRTDAAKTKKTQYFTL